MSGLTVYSEKNLRRLEIRRQIAAGDDVVEQHLCRVGWRSDVK
jgi:hypothetical protein